MSVSAWVGHYEYGKVVGYHRPVWRPAGDMISPQYPIGLGSPLRPLAWWAAAAAAAAQQWSWSTLGTTNLFLISANTVRRLVYTDSLPRWE